MCIKQSAEPPSSQNVQGRWQAATVAVPQSRHRLLASLASNEVTHTRRSSHIVNVKAVYKAIPLVLVLYIASKAARCQLTLDRSSRD